VVSATDPHGRILGSLDQNIKKALAKDITSVFT
jgi:hypothetical protein